MSTELLGKGWGRVLAEALIADGSELRIVCPFIQRSIVDRILKIRIPSVIEVITRYNLYDFYTGVNDLAALRRLLDERAAVRGVRDLHSKAYLIGNRQAIVTSANLTKAAWDDNLELGFITDEEDHVRRLRAYFDALWQQGNEDLSKAVVSRWEKVVARARRKAPPPGPMVGLSDEGVPVNISDTLLDEYGGRQAFVKFFAKHRFSQSLSATTCNNRLRHVTRTSVREARRLAPGA